MVSVYDYLTFRQFNLEVIHSVDTFLDSIIQGWLFRTLDYKRIDLLPAVPQTERSSNDDRCIELDIAKVLEEILNKTLVLLSLPLIVVIASFWLRCNLVQLTILYIVRIFQT